MQLPTQQIFQNYVKKNLNLNHGEAQHNVRTEYLKIFQFVHIDFTGIKFNKLSMITVVIIYSFIISDHCDSTGNALFSQTDRRRERVIHRHNFDSCFRVNQIFILSDSATCPEILLSETPFQSVSV